MTHNAKFVKALFFKVVDRNSLILFWSLELIAILL